MRRCRRLLAGAALLALCLAPGGTAVPAADDALAAQLDRLETAVVRAEDVSQIRKLQRAYGYYADRGLWNDLADLFAEDAIANYPSGGFDGNASIRAMFVKNLGQGQEGLAEGRIYNHTILQPVVDLADDGATATGRWRVLGMLGRFGGSATWADSLYRFDYVKRDGGWKIRALTAYAGSGGSYEQGWAPPRPRPPGAADTSPIRFNLAHPADRPWIDPCEADVSACVVPFPYPNRGGIRVDAGGSAVVTPSTASAQARAADLVARAQRLEDEQALLNLQRAYGYYIDRGLWQQAADLFAPDGSREVGHAGVYVGRKRIRASLALTRPRGLRPGELNDHLQLEPIIDVAPDGKTARGRIFELAFTGGGGEPARLVQNVHENTYVRRDGVWMIQSLHSFTILATDAQAGWAKSALPPPVASRVLPPDRPPAVAYEAYPAVFTPPLHFRGAGPTRASAFGASGQAKAKELANAQRQVQRVLDAWAIDNLQSAYGYYMEKAQWTDVAALFTDDAVLEIDGRSYRGPQRIREHLLSISAEGPVRGVLDSQLQLQPVIHVDAEGHSARMRSRLLQLTRDAEGRPMWGGGLYESALVKEEGIWKYRRLRLQRTWQVLYREGWAQSSSPDGQLLPVRFTLPFHYRNPVTGR